MSSRTVAIAAFAFVIGLAGCGDFATRKVCLPNSDANCTPDTNNFTTPNLNGPNPNFPIPANAPPPGQSFPAHAGRLKTEASNAFVVVSEVVVDPLGANLGAQKIELWNPSQLDMPVGGWFIDVPVVAGVVERITLPAGRKVEAGGFLVLHLGMLGTDDPWNLYVPGFAEMTANSGEVVLTTDSGLIADYVRWGTAPQVNEYAAALDGQWLYGTSCVKAPEGLALAFIGGGNETTDFVCKPATLGLPN